MTRADKPRAGKSAAVTASAAPAGTDETIACMHCGHINPLPGGRRPGKTVSCKLCARMFSVEAAEAHVPPPPPEPPPPPPGMTPHTPDAESIDAPVNGTNLIYTPKLAPKKKLSRTFKFAFGVAVGLFLLACGVGAAVMIPHYNRTRLAAHRNVCASNLRKIGAALERYALDNGGKFPESLAKLMVVEKLDGELFLCPLGGQTVTRGETPQARADKLIFGSHLSYAYLGRGMNRRSGAGAGYATVMAYERLSNHGDGINVLFADGRVAFVPEPQASKMINELQAGKNPTSVTGF
jgi:prepilin-type processing-associated H-X9-DG protein